MPRIRARQPDLEAARQPLPDAQADPLSTGAGVGRALEQTGQSLQVLGVSMADHRRQQDQLAANSLAARMAADWEPIYHQLRTMQPPGSPGFAEQVRDSYDRFVQERTAELSPGQYRLFRQLHEQARARQTIRAAGDEAESAAGHNRLLAEQGLTSGINLVATNPAAFNDAFRTGNLLIDSLALPGNVREEFRRSHVDKLTRGAFESRIYNAKSPAEVDAVLADLARPEWRERATPTTYDRLLDQARTYRRTLGGRVDTAVRAAIDMIDDRMKDPRGIAVDPAEIARVHGMVRASLDPGVQWRWAQLVTRHETLRTAIRAEPSALSSSINSRAMGLSLPPAVASGIEEAVRATGGQVSASYLSQLATAQSRDYIAGSRRGRPEFRLQTTHGGVNLQDVRPEVQEAGALAGEIFGAPLRITSGHRNPFYNAQVGGARGSHHTHGNALDIDITGMDAATRGRLVDSLVQAGFTGFGQYGTHLHADMRASVGASFGARPGYGGWTQLDPEMMAVLERRGFRAGRPSGEIDRSGASRAAGPAQPEQGVFGFDDATWTGLVRRHATTLGITVDMADADILKMRQDERTAAIVAGLYARENRQEMEQALGRPVSDAELGMAHVLGPAGAVSLLRAYQEAPGAAAADAVPGLTSRLGEQPARTVGQLYTDLMRQFTGGVTALEHVRMQAERDAQTQMQAARNGGDIMVFASNAGHIALSPLADDASLENRGRQALQMQRFYRLEEPRPLTADEVDRFTNVIRTGSIADVTQLMTQLQRLGPQAAAGAYQQLGQTDRVFAHVAGLASTSEANATTARDIMRGRIRIRDNPDVKQIFTGAAGGMDNQFNLVVGTALDSADPRVRQAIRHAADALYIERFAGGQAQFVPSDYVQAVNAVLGGADGAGGIGRVNGAATMLPQGVTASDFDRALDRLTPQDLASFSVNMQPPRYRDGQEVSPVDITFDAHFRATGNNQYQVIGNGGPLTTESGRPYVIELTPERVRTLLARQGMVEVDIPMLGGNP